jgi:hypothetical protein
MFLSIANKETGGRRQPTLVGSMNDHKLYLSQRSVVTNKSSKGKTKGLCRRCPALLNPGCLISWIAHHYPETSRGLRCVLFELTVKR